MGRLLDENEVIDALEKVASFFPYKIPGKGETYDKYNEAWNDAIGRAEMEIESLPSAQLAQDLPKGCTDTISRQAAIDALLEEVRLVDGYYVENDEVIDKDDAIEAIRLLPSAQPECKKGEVDTCDEDL